MSAAAPKQLNPLLAAYLRNLATNPLQTKAITTGMYAVHTPSPLPTSATSAAFFLSIAFNLNGL